MTIKVGDRMPEVTLKTSTPDGVARRFDRRAVQR